MLDFLCYTPGDSYLPKKEPASFLRFLNAAPSIKRFDAYVSHHPVSKNISFKKYTPYFNIPAGQHIISICSPGNDKKVYSSSENMFEDHLIYTVCASEFSGQVKLIVIPDIRIEPENSSANIRFTNLTQAPHAITAAYDSGPAIFPSIEPGCVSPYESFQPGKYSFRVSNAVSKDLLLIVPDIILKPGWNCTLYLTILSEENKYSYINLLDGSTYIK